MNYLKMLMCMKFMAMDYMIGEEVEDELEFYSSLDLHLIIHFDYGA